MEDEQKDNSIYTDDIINTISTENFVKLPGKTQDKILDIINANANKSGGFMGKFFGNRKENAAINVGFMICLLLTVVGIICTIAGKDHWSVIITGIMTTVGYIFGHETKK